MRDFCFWERKGKGMGGWRERTKSWIVNELLGGAGLNRVWVEGCVG
jgi:hypothetical protein